MAYDWLLAGIAAAGVIYAWRMQRQLHRSQTEIRRLKDKNSQIQSSEADAKRLDHLLASMHEPVFRLDADGRVMAANPCAKELFKLETSSFPLSLRQVYRDSDWQDALQHSMALLPELAGLPNMRVEKRVLAPRLAQVAGNYLLLFCMDVTEQHRLEMQRRTFLSNLMHDLKTPLTSLLGYARSLDRFGDDADFRIEAAQVIADEAKHVNQLLDTLLTLDQIEFMQKDSQASCDAVSVMGRVREMLAAQCSEKNISLAFESDETDETIPVLAMADDDLDRIVTNLLVNAINHSAQDGRVFIRLALQNHGCRILIEDEGPGIPEAVLHRVTERFYRVDKARARKDGGHGLGLAIVKQLVEKNNGVLTLSNRSSGGLSVEIILPLVVGS